ncbi:TadE/TadG family type IV pilus assembly protein [Sphingomicrobium nitratireducens]|uniref:TadE/TadG family type IV pilus assembly protein n=1 Tax=Sphingomicrobium nitratireducens TaxID=2964666 RepID=UPI002240A40E|nr:TadE/TadG family type IV pilus assembly protein [Sphingomicrobium nitratireducens]
MKKLLKRIWNDKRGNVLILTAAAMPMVIGAAGLATDTVQWTVTKRQLQRAADSAAFAGVYAEMQGQTVSNAVNTDLAHNNTTGLAIVGTPGITYPADTGTYSKAVRVELSVQRPLTFTALFLSEPITITAAGTAAIVPVGEYCVVSLENTGATGITATGSARLDLGCGMITNSTSLDAAVATGASTVDASPIAAVGGIDTEGNWGDDTTFLPFTVAQPDPFASVNPSPPTPCNGGSIRINSSGNVIGGGASPISTDSSGRHTFGPGCYSDIDIGAKAKFEPGIYYINGGDFDLGSQADLIATDGVTIVLTNISSSSTATIGNVDINAGAKYKIESPDSGTFKGIAIYQDRRATDTSSSSASSPNKINGHADAILEGALYFPSQQLTVNGTAGMNTACMQLVARRVYFSGTSDISNTCDSDSGASSFAGQHIRLVG